MVRLNEDFLKIKQSYLFVEVAHRVAAYSAAHPQADIIRLGIGDVTLPLGSAVVQALSKAALEMGEQKTFRGYGPEQGYDFLRSAIAAYYQKHGVSLETDEIFVSDGAKSDTGNITDIFSQDNIALISDPTYPVYADTNLMCGRTIRYADANEENGFLPLPDAQTEGDLIYICSPNNPTGAAYTKEQLALWVSWARQHGAVILFDAAYEAFIREDGIPHSIFEIEGAKECAIEFCSLSKTAGFTGTRCGYTIVPKALVVKSSTGEEMSPNRMWNRRQCTKFNGTSYIIQRGAEAAFTEQGMREARANIAYYMENAKTIGDTLAKKQIRFFGGVNSPYIWMKCPGGMDSWAFFDELLNRAQVVGTPGAGFGKNGQNYFRLTSFGTHEATAEAMARFDRLF